MCATQAKSYQSAKLFIILFCCVSMYAMLLSGCHKMTGLDFEKFEELVKQDIKKPKHKRKVSFTKIREEHIEENKPKKRKKSQQYSQSGVDLSQFTFSSSYRAPTTNEANAMLLNPLSFAEGDFTLPRGLSPHYADIIEDEMLPFPLDAKKSKKYKPTSHRELVSLVQDSSIKLSEIDTSAIRDMGYLFACNGVFLSCREDFRGIESWNTSKVVDMESMFEGNEFFNANISSWNISKVRNMSKMFHNATKFNQSLGSWGNKIQKGTKTHSMFRGSKLESNPPSWYKRR